MNAPETEKSKNITVIKANYLTNNHHMLKQGHF